MPSFLLPRKGYTTLSNLQSLDLSYTKVQLAQLQPIIQHVNLKDLYLKGCMRLKVEDASLENLSRLTRLDISECVLTTDQIGRVLSYLSPSHLTWLSLELYYSNSTHIIFYVVNNFSNLRHLSIWPQHCALMVNSDLKISNLVELVDLKLSVARMPLNSGLCKLTKLRSLWVLDSLAIMNEFQFLTTLKELSVANSSIIENIYNLVNLKSLLIFDCVGIAQERLALLTQTHPFLETLHITLDKNANCSSLFTLSKLKSLHFHSCSFTQITLENLKMLTNLKDLCFINCSDLNDKEFVSQVTQLSKLTSLKINNAVLPLGALLEIKNTFEWFTFNEENILPISSEYFEESIDDFLPDVSPAIQQRIQKNRQKKNMKKKPLHRQRH